MSYTIDANIFIRAWTTTDPQHTISDQCLSAIFGQGISMVQPTLVLVEIAGVMSRAQRDPIRARVFADSIRTQPQSQFIPLDDALTRIASDLVADLALRGADAVYVAVTQQYGTTLVTLDQEVLNRATQVVTVLHPS